MPPPPPPPRLPPPAPLPPPPLPAATGHTAQINNHSASVPDRNALLSQIRGGARLKKVATNDKSSPVIQKPQSSASGNGIKSQNSTTSGPSGLGDLFSQGMPKLRPTGNRPGEGNTIQRPGFSHNNIFHTGTNKTLNTPSQLSSSSEAQISKPNRIQTKNTFGGNELNRNVPSSGSNASHVTVKPAPPPAKLKPNFTSDSTSGSPFPKTPSQGKINALLASPKLASTIQNTTKEENIQSSLKPLPPPKQIQSPIMSDGPLQTKPLPPSKLTATARNTNIPVTRSQSNSAKDKELVKPFQPVTHSQTFTASSLTCERQSNKPEHKEMSTLTVNSSRLPVRNHSAPDMNQLIRHNSRPPPPPIPSTNRMIQSPSPRHPPQIKFQNGRPSPPPQLSLIRSAEPPPLPKSAPPPLPHRSPQTLPRFPAKSQVCPPPLPVRTASKQSNQQVGIQDFESRFKQMFHETREFPFPQYQITPHKFYMSQAYTQGIKRTPIERQIGSHLLAVKAAEC